MSAMSSSLTVCVDASLVVRLVLRPDEPALLKRWESWVSQGITPAAPGLLYYEVTNALYRYQKSGLLQPDTVRDALDTALALPIDLFSDAELHRQARIIAERYNLPAAYDAHYLALSEQLDADLWTADARFFRALQPHGVKRVKMIVP